jgi:predicted nucleotidyltransferase
MRINGNLEAPDEVISGFCQRWRITEFAFFGSVLRDDFHPDSDIDVLVTFEPGALWSLFDIVAMQEELAGIFGRNVGVIEKRSLRNPFRRRSILKSALTVYAHE